MLFGVMTNLSLKGPPVEGIELRLDLFDHIDLSSIETFIKTTPLPVMLTLRPNGARTNRERLALLELLCGLKPAYVDLEHDIPKEFRKRLFDAHPTIQFLCSYHNFEETPEDLDGLLESMHSPYAHLYKIATVAKNSIDALRLLALMKRHDHLAAMAMGEYGSITRILSPIFGGAITYAPLGEKTASGQLDVEQLEGIYCFSLLNRETKIYALIGDPVDKSLGHLAHNASFKNAAINAVYVKIPLKAAELEPFFTLIKELGFAGLSVTMPYKEAVLPFLDDITASVDELGACNTILLNASKLIGHNTDGIGSLDALEKHGQVKGKKIVVLGAGGAAKAIIYEALQRGALVLLLNRTREKAIEIAERFGCLGGGLDEFPKDDYDVLINCIPDLEQIPSDWLQSVKSVMDIVYMPKNTPLLLNASQKKCRIIYGYEMFVSQAVEQELIWLESQIEKQRAFTVIDSIVQRSLV